MGEDGNDSSETLTKRELFALVSLFGQRANPELSVNGSQNIAAMAVMDADHLMGELKRGSKSE